MKRNKPGNNNGLNQQQQPSFYNQQTFPTPGQFQAPPPPFNNPPTSNGPQKPPHNYRGWVLAIFVICYYISLGFIFAEIVALIGVPSSGTTSTVGILVIFASLLIIALNITILILDYRSFFSLFGRIRWSRLKGWQKVGLGIVYLCGAIMPAFYLFFAVQNFRRVTRQTVKQAVGFWYRSKSKNAQTVMLVAGLLFILIYGVITAAGMRYDKSQAFLALTPTATAQQQIAQSTTPTATTSSQDTGTTATVGTTPTVIPIATATPKPSPTHQPTPTPTRSSPPTPKPTPRPTQPPACQAVNNNPWCYNFSPGNLITNAPANFCSYFRCIPTFVSADDPDGGYIVECQDNTFSQSGGESGSCSHHGGNLQPLYSH